LEDTDTDFSTSTAISDSYNAPDSGIGSYTLTAPGGGAITTAPSITAAPGPEDAVITVTGGPDHAPTAVNDAFSVTPRGAPTAADHTTSTLTLTTRATGILANDTDPDIF